MSKMGFLEKIKELDNRANVELNKFKPNNICDRLNTIRERAHENREAKKFEDAYVFYKRWLLTAAWLDKQKGWDAESKKKFSSAKKKEVEKFLYEVTSYIKSQYEPEQKGSEAKTQNSFLNEDISLKLPEPPSDEPQPKRHDEITCTELFKLFNTDIKREKRVLIFDVRKDEDWLQSKIAFTKNTIHIPANKIQANKVAGVYRSMILHDKDAYELFKKRGEKFTDIVVLVDNKSSVETMKPSSPIAMFKHTLEEFDNAEDYKRIAVLKGGFEEWQNKYPNFVVHYEKKKSSMHNDSSHNDMFDDVNFDYLTSKKSTEGSTPSPILSGNHPVGRAVYPSLATVSAPTSQTKKRVSFELHNGGIHSHSVNGISDKQLLKSNNIMESSVVISKLPHRPTIDRSNKPVVDRSNKPIPGKKIVNSDSYEEVEKQLNDARQILAQFSKHRTADDWSREQYDVYDKKAQYLAEALEKLRPSQPVVEKPTKLYPELPIQNLEKMSLGTKKQAGDSPKTDFKENLEKIESPKETEIQIQINEDPTSVERTPPQSQEMDVDDDDDDDEDIYTPTYNQGLNSGLKRSISSPNLAPQPKEVRKPPKPQFDRSTKPKEIQNSRPIIMPPYRERNFDAVESSSVHPGITGLKNLGNSCYMNSIIQCLSNTEYLAKYFNNNGYLGDLNRNSDKGVTVAEEVAQVIKALWRGQYKSISPRDLKAVVGLYRLQFESYEQQDSHEFLMFLLDWMHNDLKQRSKISYTRSLTTPEKEWEKSMGGQSSIISKLFFGQLRSTIECMHCKKNSTTYETFNSLTLSLPSSTRCTLDECVKKYVSGQKVTGWKCPSCEVPRDGMKKFDISKLPHIIVIHLNRFHFTDTGSWLEKKNTAVEFPLTNLDLKPYLIQNDFIPRNNQALYNLYAMSNHYGTMEGGHYTAYCKSNTQSKWYKYDDHTVSEVQQSTVRNQSNTAYLLFYSSVSAETYLNS